MAEPKKTCEQCRCFYYAWPEEEKRRRGRCWSYSSCETHVNAEQPACPFFWLPGKEFDEKSPDRIAT
jgi:hypothetical protein